MIDWRCGLEDRFLASRYALFTVFSRTGEKDKDSRAKASEIRSKAAVRWTKLLTRNEICEKDSKLVQQLFISASHVRSVAYGGANFCVNDSEGN